MVRTIDREDETYYFTVGDKEICCTLADDDAEVKEWVSRIEKQYLKKSKDNKQTPLVVGLWAERSIGYGAGRKNLFPKLDKIFEKTAPYEMLVICVDDQCLLRELEYREREFLNPRAGYYTYDAPKALRDFLSSSRVIVVGFGIHAMVKKLENEINLLIPKQVELRDLVKEKLEQTPGEFANFDQGRLVKLAMGPEWEVVKPESLAYWDTYQWPYYLSDEFLQYCSSKAFVAAELASKLLPAEPVTKMLERKMKKLKLKR